MKGESDDKLDRQLAALLASSAIMGFFLLYWLAQIESVREMLTLAYG